MAVELQDRGWQQLIRAFSELHDLIRSDCVEYNLFSENAGGHTCELGHWNMEPGHRDETVSVWGETPAEAIQGAIEKWQRGEQYQK